MTGVAAQSRKHVVLRKIELSEAVSGDPGFTNRYWLSLVEMPTTETNWYKYRLILNHDKRDAGLGQRILRIDGNGTDDIVQWMSLLENLGGPGLLLKHFKRLEDAEIDAGPDFVVESSVFATLRSEIENAA